jgi:hypothetical protein
MLEWRLTRKSFPIILLLQFRIDRVASFKVMFPQLAGEAQRKAKAKKIDALAHTDISKSGQVDVGNRSWHTG